MARSAIAAIAATVTIVAGQPSRALAAAWQDGPERTVTVTWKTQAIPVFSPADGPDAAVAQEIVKVEEAYRVAKLSHDVAALDRILSPDFFGTNQNGNSRNKREALELFKSFPIESLVIDRATVRLGANAVIVSGEQTEVNGTGTDRMLFTRVYVQNGTDAWQLLSNTQFRNPRASN